MLNLLFIFFLHSTVVMFCSLVQISKVWPFLWCIKHQHFLSLPVCSHNIAWLHIIKGWHLESEKFNRNFSIDFLEFALLVIYKVAVFEELAAEAAENNDIVVVHLGRACSLPNREEVSPNLNWHPFSLCVRCFSVESLDRVEVLLTRCWNTSEDVNPRFIKWARAVIVAAFNEARKVEP